MRLGRRRIDVEDTLEGAELELLAGFLVDESRAVHRENLLARGKGHRAAYNGAWLRRSSRKRVVNVRI